jgi:hypothetical protein
MCVPQTAIDIPRSRARRAALCFQIRLYRPCARKFNPLEQLVRWSKPERHCAELPEVLSRARRQEIASRVWRLPVEGAPKRRAFQRLTPTLFLLDEDCLIGLIPKSAIIGGQNCRFLAESAIPAMCNHFLQNYPVVYGTPGYEGCSSPPPAGHRNTIWTRTSSKSLGPSF